MARYSTFGWVDICSRRLTGTSEQELHPHTGEYTQVRYSKAALHNDLKQETSVVSSAPRRGQERFCCLWTSVPGSENDDAQVPPKDQLAWVVKKPPSSSSGASLVERFRDKGKRTTLFVSRTMGDLNVRVERLEPMRVAAACLISETPERDAWQRLRAWGLSPRIFREDCTQLQVAEDS